MIFGRFSCAFSAVALLASCGGDGDTDQGPSPTAIPTVTPSPEPTPTPTPTATPPSYALGFDFAKNFAFSSPTAESSFRQLITPGTFSYDTTSPATAIISGGETAQFIFQASPFAATLAVGTDLKRFEEKDVFSRANNGILFSQGTADNNVSFGYSPAFPNEAYATKYVGFSRSLDVASEGSPPVARTSTHKYYLFGSRAQVDDLPTTGVHNYRVEIETSTVSYDSNLVGLQGTGTLKLDFATNQLSGSFPTRQSGWETGKEPLNATLEFTGILDPANNRITGEVTSPDGSVRGTLDGRLFGPRGAELGLLVAIRSSAGGAVGAVIGLKWAT